MSDTPDILKRIVARKRQEISERSADVSIELMQERASAASPVRGFVASMGSRIASGRAAVIAEIKKASPSKGVFREDFDPVRIAESYEHAGAACLSILTDRDFFQGSEAYLMAAREACSLPVIRKDFIIDPYQVYEARAINADCILLIVACLSDQQLESLSSLAADLQMDVLVEVHDEDELERALPLGLQLVGINNRNLRSFETDLNTTYRMLERIPEGRIVVTESGIHSAEQVAAMRRRKVDAFLVGEAFMRCQTPGEALAELFEGQL